MKALVFGRLSADAIATLRRALADRFAGIFDHMSPHMPRRFVIEAAAAARGPTACLQRVKTKAAPAATPRVPHLCSIAFYTS
jgi:hypothetical protein